MMTTKVMVRDLALALVAGILIASFFSFPQFLWSLPLIAVGLLLYLGWRQMVVIVLTITLAFGYFIWRESLAQSQTLPDSPISGQVIFRQVDEVNQLLRVEIQDYPGSILLIVPRYPEVWVSSSIQFSCVIRPTDLERQRRLWSRGYSSRCSSREVTVIGQVYDWRYYLHHWREWHLAQLKRHLPEPESSLVRATVLADEAEIPESTETEFSRSGLSHIMAISGMNMTLLIGVFIILLRLRGLSYRLILLCSTVVLSLYVIVIGQPASALRAVVMSLLALAGIAHQRTVDIRHLLYLTIITLSLINPWSVGYDLGWQLSFLALLGLLFWTERLQQWLSWLPSWIGIRAGISTTLAAQIFIWPLFLWHFQTVSIIAPLANIFALPAGALLMIQGLILPLLGMIPYLGSGFALITYYTAHWLWLVAHWFAASDWAVIAWQLNNLEFICLMALPLLITIMLSRYEKS